MDNSIHDTYGSINRPNPVFRRKEADGAPNDDYRDMTPQELQKEKHVRIALAAGAVITLIATVVAVGFAANATMLESVGYYDYTQIIGSHHGHLLYKWIETGTKVVSIGTVAIAPGIVGGATTIALGAGAVLINHEKGRPKDFSVPGVVEGEILNITQIGIHEASERYYIRGELSIGSLVRQGIISKEQGDAMSTSLRNYEEQLSRQRTWTNSYNMRLNLALDKNPEQFPEYQNILDSIESAKKQWQEVQRSIHGEYFY